MIKDVASPTGVKSSGMADGSTQWAEDAGKRRTARLISGLLRWGVRASLTLFVIGTVIGFARGQEYGKSREDLARLTAASGEFPRDLHWLVKGVSCGRGAAMVVLGLLLLIVTPVLRVGLSLVAFASQRDRVFVFLTAAVLALLALSFVFG